MNEWMKRKRKQTNKVLNTYKTKKKHRQTQWTSEWSKQPTNQTTKKEYSIYVLKKTIYLILARFLFFLSYSFLFHHFILDFFFNITEFHSEFFVYRLMFVWRLSLNETLLHIHVDLPSFKFQFYLIILIHFGRKKTFCFFLFISSRSSSSSSTESTII